MAKNADTNAWRTSSKSFDLTLSGHCEDGDSEWKAQVSQEKTFRTEKVEQHGI
jgi:hypothetical protein